MFAKSKNLRDQAQDLGDQLREQLGPHVDNAREQLAPRLAEAREQLAPRIAEAREQLGPVIADARDKAAPHVADARERLVNDVIPAVQSALADAREQAGPVAEEARRRGAAAAIALKGDDPAPKRGKKKWLALLALVGAGAVAAKKLLGEGSGSHAAYTPPAYPPPGTPTGAAPGALADDAAGATPEEALSDMADEPHDVTTPADPAEVVDIPKE